MSAFLSFDAVSARTPDHRVLFSGLTFSVGRERVGLVGRNGVGKSTLLRIAAGASMQAAGTVRRSGAIATLAQAWPDTACLAEALGVAGALARIDRITAGHAGNGDLDDVDWNLPGRIDGVLSGIGLADVGLDRSVGTLSGGERMRVAIAGLMMTAPDLLLLDEPTNSLDDAGREAIAALLRTHAGGALVASHDRALLERMDRIVELTSVGVRIIGGGWSAFVSARDAERARTEAALERAEAALEDARRTAQVQREAREQRDKAGRADAARGSAPKIALDRCAERAERSGGQTQRLGARRIVAADAEADQARSRLVVTVPFAVSLPPCGIPPAHLVLDLREAVVDRGARRLGPWSLALRGPERIAVVGRNGAGKSTLMQLAAGLLQPDAGAVLRSDRIALLDQYAMLLVWPDTVLANLRRCDPSLGEQEAHAVCARFGFRNRAADRSVDTLSGGERLRAALCCVLGVACPPWLLLLDEPTNHLDLDAIAVLEAALRGFDGALLVASHDASLLDAIGIGRRYAA